MVQSEHYNKEYDFNLFVYPSWEELLFMKIFIFISLFHYE